MLVREVTTITKCQGQISIVHSPPPFFFFFSQFFIPFWLMTFPLGFSGYIRNSWHYMGGVIFGSLGEGTISGVSIVCESFLSTSFSLGFLSVGVGSCKSFWMLSSTTSPLCNEFLVGAKSLTETVDSQPLVNLMWAYWGFALSNTTL